jgi:hypothetical protein
MKQAFNGIRAAVSDYAIGTVIAVMLTALARREAARSQRL